MTMTTKVKTQPRRKRLPIDQALQKLHELQRTQAPVAHHVSVSRGVAGQLTVRMKANHVGDTTDAFTVMAAALTERVAPLFEGNDALVNITVEVKIGVTPVTTYASEV